MSDMDSAIQLFKAMMRDQVAPELRRLGFKGSGQSFLLPSERYWALLGFQKSMYGTRAVVKFTVNATVVDKGVWTESRENHPYLSERPKANTLWVVGWWKRIGSLLPDPHDKWWTVTNEVEAEAAAAEVLAAIQTHVLPAMRLQMETSETA